MSLPLPSRAAALAKQEKAELDTNLGALAKAISALEKGMAGAFVQTPAATIVRKFAMEKARAHAGV